jgi:hypothetical protein
MALLVGIEFRAVMGFPIAGYLLAEGKLLVWV